MDHLLLDEETPLQKDTRSKIIDISVGVQGTASSYFISTCHKHLIITKTWNLTNFLPSSTPLIWFKNWRSTKIQSIPTQNNLLGFYFRRHNTRKKQTHRIYPRENFNQRSSPKWYFFREKSSTNITVFLSLSRNFKKRRFFNWINIHFVGYFSRNSKNYF